MDLKDLLDHIAEDPEELRRCQGLEAKLEALRIRVRDMPEGILDAEIVEAIRVRFELVSAGDFLDETPWLMNALSFTHATITGDSIPEAWENFQRTKDLPYFSLDDYPVLEGIAHWYVEHRQDPGQDENAMVARSLAVYEYLLAQVRGHEADPSYQDLLSGNGPTVVYLYCALGNYDRAKFYIQLLANEYKFDRLPEEDYLEVMRAYELLLIKERGETITNVEKQLHEINRLCWDTISARDRQIDVLGEEKTELLEKLTRKANPALFVEAKERLSIKFGLSWNKLHADTRRFVTIADVFMQEPFLNSWPGGGATCAYLAVKSELLHRFSPHRHNRLSEALKKTKGDPIKLLLTFRNDKKKLFTQEEREFIKSVLHSAFGGRLDLTEHMRKMIELLKDHRDQAQHPEGMHPYRVEQFEEFKLKLWDSGWLNGLLTRGL